jgi:hypothetical protein
VSKAAVRHDTEALEFMMYLRAEDFQKKGHEQDGRAWIDLMNHFDLTLDANDWANTFRLILNNGTSHRLFAKPLHGIHCGFP